MTISLQAVAPEQTIVSTNPSRGYEVIGDVEVSSPEEVQSKVQAAREAFSSWSQLSVEERLVPATKSTRSFYYA